jgi:hypothetical protein
LVGGIYIDEATYSRLPPDLMTFFETLEPLTVKGKPHPIPAFSFPQSMKAPEHSEPVAADDFDVKIRITCRTILTRLLEGLLGPEKSRTKKSGMSAKISTMSSKFTSVSTKLGGLSAKLRLTTETSTDPLQIVVLEGRVGSGKHTTVQWLCSEAKHREIRVVKVSRLEPKDAFLDYRVMSRLFQGFIGRENYENLNSQRLVVTHLLKEIYGSNADVIERVALPAMRVAFDLTFPSLAVKDDGTASSFPLAKQRKLPVRMVIDTIRDVFNFLLNEQPTIIVVEDLHYCDEDSLKCLMSFRELQANSLAVFTLLSSDDTAAINSAIIRMQTKRIAVHGLDMFRTVMSQHTETSYIHLDDFNVTEIDAMIRAALQLQTVPLGLAQWVQQLSGGSIFWINEMLDFIKNTGTDEFLNITNFQSFSNGNSTAVQMSIARSKIMVGSVQKAPLTLEGLPPLVAAMATSPSSPTPDRPGDTKKSQLEHFILCRFEKLPLDDQRILKSASVIGVDFSRYVLYGILPPALKSQLHAALKNLIKEKWLTKATEQGNVALALANAGIGNTASALVSGNDAEYVFSHPLAWETLYGLIPPGDRTRLHRTIGEYYENMAGDEPVLFDRISAHFSHCDRSKACEFAMKAAAYALQPGSQDLQKALNMLLEGVSFCQAVVDVDIAQTILGTTQMIFYSDVDNIALRPPDLATPTAAKSKTAASTSTSAGKHNKGVSKQEKSSSWSCCGSGVSSQIKTNTVAPDPRKPGNNNNNPSEDSNKFILTAEQTFSDEGKAYIQELLEYLTHHLQKLRADLEKEGKVGTMRRWQRELMAMDGGEDEGSWKEQSMMSKMSWTFKPTSIYHNRR